MFRLRVWHLHAQSAPHYCIQFREYTVQRAHGLNDHIELVLLLERKDKYTTIIRGYWRLQGFALM